MSAWRLIIRSLLRHGRTNAAVALGVAAATAVLTGALLVGDSMRGSLRRLALDRLGRIDQVILANRFFRAELADELAASEGFGDHFEETAPIVLLRATLENPQNGRRAGQATVMGVTPDFWSLASTPAPPLPSLGARDIVLNQALARELQVKSGQDVMLRVGQANQIPADSPLGRNIQALRSRRLTVAAVIPAEGLGRFALRPSQQSPLNAYAPLETIQDLADRPQKVNAILIAGRSADRAPSEAASRLAHRFLKPGRDASGPSLADLGLSLERVQLEHEGETILDYYSLTSDRLLLPPAADEAAMAALSADSPQPVFTYLANYLLAEDGKAKIPYSAVTAVDSTAALGPLVGEDGAPIPLSDDEIVLNRWAAEDLAAQGVRVQPGDGIQLTYFEPESTHGEEREETRSLRLRAIAPLARPGARPERTNDTHLTPTTPGLTDEASIDNWNPPFPYDKDRVRIHPPEDQDERYWREYGLTPKAFVSLAAGRRLWKSRFGQTTSIRVAHRPGLSEEVIEQKLRAALDAEALGFSVADVKRESLEAAEGTTSFSGLFLGFSFFLIAAAVMLVALLFRLGVQQRAGQLGVLQAVGLRRRRVARMLVAEGLVVAGVGGVAGVALGVAYAQLLLAGLQSWCLEAIVTPFLRLYATPTSLAIGGCSGVVVSALSIGWTVRSLRRVSVRRLLAGEATESLTVSPARGRFGRRTAYALLIAAAALVIAGTQLSGESEAGSFFCSGGAVLAAGLLLVRSRLVEQASRGRLPVRRLAIAGLAMRSVSRHPGRSTLTMGLVASASFLIVAIGAFRLAPTLQRAGGFQLVAESDRPIAQDLNAPSVRAAMNFSSDDARELAGSRIVSLRVQAGDDASCLNLYRPRRPRVLGVPDSLIDRYSQTDETPFLWAESGATTPEEKANPWLLLRQQFDDGAIPVILDKSTAVYSLHLFTFQGTGAEFQIEYEDGQTVRFRIVGLLSDSIFQGNLVISESRFRELFPDVNGYQFFLIRTPAQRSQRVLELLEDRLGGQGFDAQLATRRLEGFLAVQNTYLWTFQSLGALGLLLGTLGLAAVQVRSVMERRGELALLRAAGFRRAAIARLVFLENAVLLGGGMGVGVVAAAAAVLPHWLAGGASLPAAALVGLLALVFAAGLLSGWAAVRAALRAPLVAALRGD